MNCNAQVFIFKNSQNVYTEKPITWVKRKHAERLVERGIAEWCGHQGIRFLPAREVVVSSNVVDSEKQGWAYLSAATDKNPQFFQGGLTRDEHKPAKFEPFKAARVGHQ